MYNMNNKRHGQDNMVMKREAVDNLLNYFKEMQELALEIKEMYKLLDERNHQLTYITTRMENHFSQLFKLVYGCLPLRGDFKSTIERICNEKEQVETTLSQTFFPVKNNCN